ncbi:H-NS family nucleoid-associated regulatory protein [Paraburkholderia sp. 22B1P]|uniref:H-NS family nucleoid-associated regulatory protein n=2 Tax=Burkholderiaceae TaxID=119060 RepID=UPI0030D585D9
MSLPETKVDSETRARLILWMKRRMVECGISVEALAASIEEDKTKAPAIRYRDASGNSWSGDGPLPSWLQRAVAAGQSIEHFRTSGE